MGITMRQHLYPLILQRSISMSIYHFIYKTTHSNGRYYIGRHSTNNLNDGYLGSGKWVKSIKDKSTLSRDIISYANDIEELKLLEEQYINTHFDNPLCMNHSKSSHGFDSESASVINTQSNKKRIQNGTHNWLKRPDGTSHATDRIQKGSHNWQKRPDGSSHATDKVTDGTHNFLTRPDGTNINTDRIQNGTHNWLKRPDGSSLGSDIAKQRIKNGTHHFVNNHPVNIKMKCPHCGITMGKPHYIRYHGDNCKYKV